jgi:hypothetical protein
MPFYIIPRKHNLKKHTFIFILITTCIEKKKLISHRKQNLP